MLAAECADAVIAALEDVGAAVVRKVGVPENLPPGWDLADDVPDDLTGGGETSDVDFLRPYLDQATPAVANVKMPHGYSMERGGLYFTPEQEGDLPEEGKGLHPLQRDCRDAGRGQHGVGCPD